MEGGKKKTQTFRSESTDALQTPRYQVSRCCKKVQANELRLRWNDMKREELESKEREGMGGGGLRAEV